VLAITAITLKTVFNYLFVRLKNVLYGLRAAAAAVDFHAALARRVQFTRQKRSDRGRAAGKIKNLCFVLKKLNCLCCSTRDIFKIADQIRPFQ